MVLEKTEAYISVVDKDHKIKVPKSLPVGAKVAIILVEAAPEQESARQQRFATTLEAIRAASTYPSADLSEADIDLLISKARRANA